ncbi:MAG: purine-nucleoside phosphorylase [Clostridia bacterium]|nr:purine-nucleoside phosphorylase [Clostridia bacterium]
MIEKAGFKDYIESASYIRSKLPAQPDIAIILGSGLGGFADTLTDTVVIPYRDIPNFPVSTVSYQKGELVYGICEGKKILAMNGRFHYYEGYEMWQTAYPIGVFKQLGIKYLIITNAAGGISDSYRLGDLVCINDHIKLSPDSPLRGQNISEFGPRFFDMQSVYDKSLAHLAKEKASELGIELKDGIYGYMTGPQYETPAEIRMLRMMGATVVGMSTVAEVIFAAQCRIPVLCISCVTNMAAGITGAAITENEVLETGKLISGRFKALITSVISGISGI